MQPVRNPPGGSTPRVRPLLTPRPLHPDAPGEVVLCRQAAARSRLLSTHVGTLVWATSDDLLVTSCRASGLDGLQPAPGTLVGRPLRECLTASAEAWLDAHQRALRGETVELQAEWLGRSFEARVEPLRDGEGNRVGVVGAALDVTLVRRAQDELLRSSLRDGLTGLLNRTGFLELLARMAGAERGPALLLVNLDGFKGVNDAAGYQGGDQVLLEASHRLEAVLRERDVLARLGGDEFGILLTELGDARDAAPVAERVLAALEAPIEVGGREFHPQASVGIAQGGPGRQADELLRDAETAMLRAKVQGKARYQVFDGPYDSHALTLLRVEAELRRALERDDLRNNYAPTVAYKGGRVSGFEVLLWRRGVQPASRPTKR